MKVKVFDIEADGLKPTKIHCLSAMYNGKPRSTSSYKNMRLFFSGEDCYWVGHNITRFDIPVLERLAGVVVDPTRLIDTLALSWYLQPDRHRHGLESYGVEYGMLKKEIDDWENLSLVEYMVRCNRDVEINTRLWEEQYKHLMAIYGDEEEVFRFVSYISFKMWCPKEQERFRWLLDVRRAERDRLS